MSSLIGLSINLSKIDKSKIVEGKNGAKYLDLTLSINDDTDQYGNNVSCCHSQSQEERQAKDKKVYIGNGKVFWTTNTICKAEKTLGEFAKVASSGPDNEPAF